MSPYYQPTVHFYRADAALLQAMSKYAVPLFLPLKAFTAQNIGAYQNISV